ncbi:MAG TPA: hypothetical protein VGF77_08265 [Allosphingosinicella sp.]|jgi:hypothetical protein
MNAIYVPPRPENPFAAACAKLRRLGHQVSPAPGGVGLTDVEGIGRDLTIDQVISIAASL